MQKWEFSACVNIACIQIRMVYVQNLTVFCLYFYLGYILSIFDSDKIFNILTLILTIYRVAKIQLKYNWTSYKILNEIFIQIL